MDYEFDEWEGFERATWCREVNVRSFIQHNYTPYDGNEGFLEKPTRATLDLWEQVCELTKEELEKGGVLDMDTEIISTITSHGPGYLNKEKDGISNTFSIIPGALGKEDQIFCGDIDVDLDCGSGACFSQTLFEGLDADVTE